ncbi:PrsW family glutamic-type intramembrane protease [Prochlorothrix hollandica]|uniref:PrsW family glutamic-type intramembrane protease n=1 Tax=Prochlorothrix hollandica TaxID=1223 RepID=UPI003340A0BB
MNPTAVLILEPAPGQADLPPDLPSDFPRCYGLSPHRENRLGRNGDCAIALDYPPFQVVSRYHAVIQAFPAVRGRSRVVWQLRDLDSANGTYLNGDRLGESHWLVPGDRLQLGSTGPCFRFELGSGDPEGDRPPQSSPTPVSALTLSQLFPLLSTDSDFFHKAWLVPGSITVAMVVSLFAAFGNPLIFNRLLGLYLSLAGYYLFIYRLCGHRKPWWVLLLTAGTMALILQSPLTPWSLWLFREVLPGALPVAGDGLSRGQQFGRLFVGTGLLEEGLKALPVLLCWAMGRVLPDPWRQRVGLWEPLDGILLGAAAAGGFSLVETLGQYVPQVMAHMTLTAGTEAGELAGLQLLIPRLLGAIAGHMAYSGYFGYFMGLSVLRSRYQWLILGVGYGSAALLHSLWNWAGLGSLVWLTVAGLLSYGVLMAAILKGRSLSPTRSQNFATGLYSAGKSGDKPSQKP